MDICFIRPSIIVPAKNITTIFTPPLGLAYVAGAVREAGFGVQLIDGVGESLDTRHPAPNNCYFYGLSQDQIVERIDPDAKVIGVAFGFSFDWPACRDLVTAIRARYPDKLLIGGGEHITALPEQSLQESSLDLCVLGEGEETTIEVTAAYLAGRLDTKSVAGIAFRNDEGGITVNQRRERRRDIDGIPWPAWDLLPIENYLERGDGFGVNRGRCLPVMASRGCPYQCTFCSNPQMWTTRWIARDADLLLDEMQAYQERYKIDNFDFYDLTAIVKKSWILEFCRKIEERGMSFTWQLPSGTRSEAIDGEVAALLYKSGCRNMSYSPESGSPTVLKRIKKKISTDSVIQSIRAGFKEGMNIKCNIIFGFPGETMKEIMQSYRFIIRMGMAGAFDISVWAFSPYPGSELFNEIAKKQNFTLDDAYFDSLRSYADPSMTVSYSEHISNERLKTLRTIGTILFYLAAWIRRPYRPFLSIYNVMRGRQESRSEMGLLNILRRKRIATETAG
ncbi:MAG: B12-binding domain-containing radical SAM protein [Rhodospirillales bacterium]|nr:B12-binding domain-containing radical SAM protein [Rhodospirillales bacterium]